MMSWIVNREIMDLYVAGYPLLYECSGLAAWGSLGEQTSPDIWSTFEACRVSNLSCVDIPLISMRMVGQSFYLERCVSYLLLC